MNFTHPVILVLIPLFAGLLFFAGRQTRKRRGGWHWWLSFILRTCLIILLVGILAGVRFRKESPDRCRLYLVDNSGSIFLNQMEILDAIQKDVKDLKPTDRVGLIVFGGDASVEIAPTAPQDFSPGASLSSRVNQNQTDIAGALQLAITVLPDGYQPEIILLSDGRETKGLVKKIIPLFQKQGITINTLGIGPNNFADLAITEFFLPPVALEHQPIEGYITLESTVDTEGNLYLYESGKLVNQWTNIALRANQPTKIGIQGLTVDKTIQEYEAVLTTPSFKEICTANNYDRVIVVQRAKPTILYLSGNGEPAVLQNIIRNPPLMDTWSVLGGDAQKSLANLPLYDLLILDNVPKSELKEEEISVIKGFVNNGGGLLLLGGKKSYALGGYPGTVLEEVAPVWFSPPDNIGLVIILDRSGSMSELVGLTDTKWQVARRALEEAGRLLSPQDEWEIIIFNNQYQVITPLQKTGNQDEVKKNLADIQPDGSTLVLPPIQLQAQPDLVKTRTARKHIILISDGTSTEGETVAGAGSAGKELQQKGITVSTIATGESVDENFLRALSQGETNGRYYRVTDFLKLVDFLKEDIAFQKKLYVEEPVQAEVSKSASGFPNALPMLNGYNRLSLKERTTVLISAPNNDPLLAEWRYGRGKVMVFGSTLNKNWAGNWLAWIQLGHFWQIILQGLTPSREDDRDLIINTTLSSDRQEMKMQITSIEKRANLKLIAEIIKNGQVISRHQVSHVAPAEYELTVPGLPEGSYLIRLYETTGAIGEEWKLVKTIPVIIPYSTEWRQFGIDKQLLKEIAEATGGKFLTHLGQEKPAFLLNKTTLTYQNHDIILLLIGLGIFLIDLLVKLLPLPR